MKMSNNKVSGSQIRNLKRINSAPLSRVKSTGMYSISVDDINFDIILFKKKGLSKGAPIFVFFSGFVNRKVTQLPAFQRWSWHDRFPGHTLYISDPTLMKTEDLGLGWYIGERHFDINKSIAKIVRSVARNLNSNAEKIVFYGSSGGGFAAIRALVEVPEASAVAINPQTILTNFEGTSLQRYLDVFFEGMNRKEFFEKHSYRNSLLSRVELIKDSRIVYLQNKLDKHHMDQHFSLFFAQDGDEWVPRYLNDVHLIFFEDPAGHGVGEPPEIVPKLLEKINL